MITTPTLPWPKREKKGPKSGSFIKRVFHWKWTSILLLGLLSNTVINAILDYKYQKPLLSVSIEEYINAIFGALILLTGTRWITGKIEGRYPWSQGVMKRLFIQLSLHLLFIASCFNLVLILYTYLLYGGFYTFSDMMVIDATVVVLAFLFSAIDTSIDFFGNWKQLEGAKAASLNETKIEISTGKSRVLIATSDIVGAMYEHGAVYLYTKAQKRWLYGKSLDSLESTLTDIPYFRANRQCLLSHEAVQSFRSLPQGKIEASVILKEQLVQLTISRAKAASFRQWMKAQTV